MAIENNIKEVMKQKPQPEKHIQVDINMTQISREF